MGELIEQVVSALQSAGIPAETGLPSHPYRRVAAPRAGVRLRRLHSTGSGLGDYLGIAETADGRLAERYGRRMRAEILIRVLAPDADSAAATAESVWETVVCGAAGASFESVEITDGGFDAESDCFFRDVVVEAHAMLIAERGGQEPEFTEFHLEGELR